MNGVQSLENLNITMYIVLFLVTTLYEIYYYFVYTDVMQILRKTIENSEGRFDCIMCGRSISTKGNLRVHLETLHSVLSRPQRCHLCGRFYKTKESLRHHIRCTHHK
jgi:hypothetical protein